MIARRVVAALLLGGALLAYASPAAAQSPAPPAAAPAWVAWPLPVPPGGRFQTPSGVPGDLSFFSTNRGLMTVGGNNSVPEGVYSWDGVEWHQLATVCGSGLNARIAWAGPDEFWTIARPSLPRDPATGLALCHFKGGDVVGSFSSLPMSEDSYLEMSAAACNGPDDCWFGGVAGTDGRGARSGGFHLRWNGTNVQTVYSPQGRAVSDLLADGSRFFESTYVGGYPGGPANSAILREPEDTPRLLHRIQGDAFANDPFAPLAPFAASTELRALDSDGTTRWAVGGGAAFDGQPQTRTPLAARLEEGDRWRELTLTGDPLPQNETFGDVAAIPGTRAAWVTLIATSAAEGGRGLQPKIAHINAEGVVRIVELARPGEPRGAAVRIDCPAPDDCWTATALGYLYRLAGAPASYPRDTDPAFQGTITLRPNEAAEQSIPDDPPQDDSLLLAPPVELPPEPEAGEQGVEETCEPPRLISRQRSTVRGKKRLKLVVSFRLARQATVGLTAKRGGKVVARAKPRVLRRGTRSFTLSITRKRYPKQLSFVVRSDPGRADACATASSSRTTGP